MLRLVSIQLLLLLLLSTPITLLANDAHALWSEALQAQQNGQLGHAIEQYEQLLATGHTAPELHNNLGLAYYHQSELGEAIVHFERALRQAPNYEDARHHLMAAQQRIQVPVEASAPIALTVFWQSLYRALPSSGWGIVTFLLLALAAALVGRAIWRGTSLRSIPPALRWSLGLIILSLFTLVLGRTHYLEETDRSWAVITAPQAGIRSAPELSSPELDVLSEGIGVRIVEERDEWAQVQLPNYVIGWVPSSLLERI